MTLWSREEEGGRGGCHCLFYCFFLSALAVYLCFQGPLSHIAAIACHKLWRLPYFRVIRGNYALRRQVIAAGACVRVCVAAD